MGLFWIKPSLAVVLRGVECAFLTVARSRAKRPTGCCGPSSANLPPFTAQSKFEGDIEAVGENKSIKRIDSIR
ncbi:hypothetical protein F4778DRAFT_731078 [Xylariomycetidae sp. FL2044]|nr:hypothetical protein F4778DRAFT_731078 [Xylariomycetidae sp. FL2044]